ncbi:MAG: amino acid ABC transporter permease [Erysipelotrichaceae bacterium]|nr:amino acid ABC transporter permease [Erysipelotrichaceae bacterium]
MSSRLWDILVQSLPRLLIPFLTISLKLTVLTFIVGTLFAAVIAIVQIAEVPVLKQLARIYIWIFRSTPLLLQLWIIFYGLPTLGIKMGGFTAAVIAYSMNEAAYNSEIIRSSILSVPQGQIEAGYMVGMNYFQIMMKVVLPQAARIAFPPMFNSLIALVKDTSLASTVTVIEMMAVARQIAARYYEPFALYCETGLIYLIVCTLLTRLQSYLEGKLVWKSSDKLPSVEIESLKAQREKKTMRHRVNGDHADWE